MVEFIRNMVEVIFKEALMPTGRNLVPTIKYAGLITVISALCTIFKLPTYFSVSSCLLAVVVLLGILHVERSQYKKVTEFYEEVERRSKHAISELHRNAQLRKEASESRQQTTSSGSEDE